MTQKILVHHTGHSFYRSIVRNLVQYHSSSYDINIQILHRQLFDIVHRFKPDIVLLPVAEYTQEFHDFVSEYHGSISIVLLVDRVSNGPLVNFWKDCKVKIIVDNRLSEPYLGHKNITYPRLYDGDIFSHLQKERNEKVAVILSDNNDRNNQTIQQDWLYPINTDSALVLFNNPAFRHPQNVGIFNHADLNIVLNTFTYLLDIDDQYPMEAEICRIRNIDINRISEININKPDSYIFKDLNISQDNLVKQSNKFFVDHTLVPFLN